MNKDHQYYLFLDTNILLHFQLFTEIDWLQILASRQIKIFFPPVIIRELDKKKIEVSSKKIRDRAKTIISKLKELRKVGSFVVKDVTIPIAFINEEPKIDWDVAQLDPNLNDDRLIASISTFAESEQMLSSVRLVTNDFGLQLKADAKRITFIDLPESYALALADDPVDSDLRRTKAELVKLQSQFPKLEVYFASVNSDKRISFSLKEMSPMPSKSEIENRTKQIEAELLKKIPLENRQNFSNQTFADVFRNFAVPPERIKEYKDEVAKYLQLLPDHFREEYLSLDLINRTIELQFKLVNLGSAPADDTEIFFHFPDGFELIEKKPPRYKIPDPPHPPKNFFDQMNDMMRMSEIPYIHGLPFPLPGIPNVSKPQIRKTNSYDVRVRVTRIKHKMEVNLDSFWVIFPSIAAAKSFNVNYEILAANYPEAFSGSLHVVIDKN